MSNKFCLYPYQRVSYLHLLDIDVGKDCCLQILNKFCQVEVTVDLEMFARN